MADDTQQTQVPATTPASAGDPVSKKPAGDQPNPLDVLEKLLNEIDDDKSGGKPSAKDLLKKGQTIDPKKPAGPTPEEIAAKELEQQRLEYEKIKAEHLIIDQKKIEEQKTALANEMQHGEANVARAQQDEEKKQENADKEESEDGFEVVQLDHTKI